MINYEDITLEAIYANNNDELIINKNGVNFYFKLNLKDTYETIVIFSNGAIDRKKKLPPVYMRSKWQEEIKSSCIFVDDPTIHGTNLSIGWGIGTPETYYLLEINQILNRIFDVYGFEARNVFYYGSSAGGTMSLILSSMHLGSNAIVNNPQIRVEKFLSGRTINEIREELFTSHSEVEFLNEFNDRLSVPIAFKKYNYVPKTIYLFNRLAYGDYGIHYKALIEDTKLSNVNLDNINFLMYNKPELGHNPISKDNTISILNTYIANPSLWV